VTNTDLIALVESNVRVMVALEGKSQAQQDELRTAIETLRLLREEQTKGNAGLAQLALYLEREEEVRHEAAKESAKEEARLKAKAEGELELAEATERKNAAEALAARNKRLGQVSTVAVAILGPLATLIIAWLAGWLGVDVPLEVIP
jgi:hypothetical protein